MGYFAGFDTFAYPGDEIMKSLWTHTNLYWCGFYLGPRFDWTPHYPKIKEIGWGIAPIYTGKQPGTSKTLQLINQRYHGQPDALRTALYDNGRADGEEAAQQAGTAGIRPRSVIYFDVENTVPDSSWLTYYRGWSRALVERSFSVGVYTRREHASWLLGQLTSQPGFDVCLPYVWIAYYKHANPNGAPVPPKDFLANPLPEPDPADIWKGATAWQHLGNMGVTWKDETKHAPHQQQRFAPVDFNSSIHRDPSLGVLSAVVYGV